MSEATIINRLSILIGQEATSNQFEIDARFSSLCKAVNYLVTQIQITAKLDREDAQDHVEKVLESTVKILQP